MSRKTFLTWPRLINIYLTVPPKIFSNLRNFIIYKYKFQIKRPFAENIFWEKNFLVKNKCDFIDTNLRQQKNTDLAL